MHLIAPLCSGVRGAELGTVRLYRRGTSTRATWYADFEASSANGSGDDIDLDSNGGALVFVNELVLVQVFDADGTQVREFVAGDQAYAVEARSAGFTGIDYTTGASALNNPVTVGALLDRWFTSAGGTDWEGLYGGSSTALKYIFGALYGLFYNPKSPQYGAVGNGVANDVAAIQAAHDAAVAAGGGCVVLPPGEYNISAALNWSTSVSLFAVPGTVVLRQTAAATGHISIAAVLLSIDTPTLICGLQFDSTVANSATQVTLGHGSARAVSFFNCTFGGNANCTGAGISLGGAITGPTCAVNCSFTARADTTLVRDTSTSSNLNSLTLEGCYFYGYTGATSSPLVQSDNNDLNLRGCRFLMQGSAGTPVALFVDDTTATLYVTGCRFRSIGSGGGYCVQIIAGSRVFMSASDYNVSGGILLKPAVTTLLANDSQVCLDRGFYNVGGVGATTVLPDERETYYVDSTFATASSITLPNISRLGQIAHVIIRNSSGGNWGASTPTFIAPAGGAIKWSTATLPNLNNGLSMNVIFRAFSIGGFNTWVQQAAYASSI